jgi:hypothetical protein
VNKKNPWLGVFTFELECASVTACEKFASRWLYLHDAIMDKTFDLFPQQQKAHIPAQQNSTAGPGGTPAYED